MLHLFSQYSKFLLLVLSLVSIGNLGGFSSYAQTGSIPRMVSLRAEEVNVRSGPGIRYPVQWVFQRKYMPVEVIAEYDTWRKIRDWEGAEGWVHRAMLSSQRAIVVIGDEATMRRQDKIKSPAVARLSQGMVAKIEECQRAWCYLNVRGYSGWVSRQGLWGLYPEEIIE